jgi:hypothetical protein
MTADTTVPLRPHPRETTIARAIREVDYFRRSPSRIGGPPAHKEWQHFLVHAPGLDVLLNFNLLDDPWVDDADREVHRLIFLVRIDGTWHGGIERFEQTEVALQSGEIGARFGESTMAFDGSGYHAAIRLRESPLSADLTFEPLALPLYIQCQPLCPGRSMSYVLVPRLLCRGHVTIGSRRIEIDREPAYHDHNWGCFQWGEDFSWEWGAAQPRRVDCPWSVVYARMLDRRRLVSKRCGVFVWLGERLHRLFRDDEIRVHSEGRYERTQLAQIPPVMRLLGGGLRDVPARIELTACDQTDSLELTFDATDALQVILPNDADLTGVTVLNEVTGRVSARGRVRGVRVEWDGPGAFEFLRS